jgi:arylsulfatase A-like enzyme
MSGHNWILAVSCVAGLTAVADAADRRPNVVMFLVDDMGWRDSSAYGSEFYQTPHMERLATQSMRFTDAYAVPLCSPTRASLLTGQYSSRHGVTSATGHQPPAPPGSSPYPDSAPPSQRLLYPRSRNYLDPELATLGEVLRDAGYRTGHFGKWHLGLMPEHRPLEHGFEFSWHCAPDPGPPSYFSPYGVKPSGRPSGQQKIGNITDGPPGEYITDRLTDEALKFIDAHKDEPFLLHLWHYGVHGPWGHKQEYTARFAEQVDPDDPQRNPIMASMLQSIDDSLGRVLDHLDELGLTDETLLIFYSDNGGNTHSNTPDSRQMQNIRPGHPRYAFVEDWKKWAGGLPPTSNAPLREGKGRIYEGGQRVPLMVRWPGRIEPGSTSDAVVGPIDLFPTILDALGVDPPADHIVDGVSILPVLKQTGTLDREAYFTWFPHLIPAVSVRAGDYKLISRWEPHRDYPDLVELYDLRTDIGETTNLAPQMPEKVAELQKLIDDFIVETGALVPKQNPSFRRQPAAAAPADPMDGLVARQSRIMLQEGALRVTATGRNPFLGTAQVRAAGPLTLRLRVRSQRAGTGSVQWKTAGQEDFPAQGQRVTFTVAAADDWQDVQVDLPIEGRTAVIRLYLPADAGPVDLQRIEYSSTRTGDTIRTWDFAATRQPASR